MLLGVVSPTYLKFDTDNRLIRKLDSIFNDSKVQFYDYSDFKTVYNQASFFKDQIHMNHTGTDKFSTEMIAILKRKLKTE